MSWFHNLSNGSKAEILSGILHELVDHTPSISRRMSKKQKMRLNKVLSDCSILADDLTEVDFKNIRDYFKELRTN